MYVLQDHIQIHVPSTMKNGFAIFILPNYKYLYTT